MRKILGRRFFNRPALVVARALLGKFLVRRWGRKRVALQISEVEAYDGLRDRASHAHRGKTTRNAPMFGEAGRWYLYFVYGTHWMLNIVTGPRGYPAAVLIRSAGEVQGPGRLTHALHLGGRENTQPSARKTGLWIEDRGEKPRRVQIARSPRIGVAYAGPVWAKKQYRFVLR